MDMRLTLFLLLCLLTATSAEVSTSSACPGQPLKLACMKTSERLVIRQAYYGPNSSCTNPPAQSPNGHICVHPDPVGALARSCFGRNKRLIESSFKGEVFPLVEEACKGVELYASVEYDCVEANAIKSICVDQTPIRLPSHGYVTSQNYPDDYYNGRACQRALVGREGQMITITMFDLEMEYSLESNQCYDFVLFKQNVDGQSARQFCGNKLIPKDLQFKYPLAGDDQINISFESSGERRFRGFLFEYQVTGCATEDVPQAPWNGLVTSLIVSDYVTYGCYYGYSLASASGGKVTCSSSGSWVGDPGKCITAIVPAPATTSSPAPESTTMRSPTTSSPMPTSTTSRTTTTTQSPPTAIPTSTAMPPSRTTRTSSTVTLFPEWSFGPISSTQKTTTTEYVPVWAMQPVDEDTTKPPSTTPPGSKAFSTVGTALEAESSTVFEVPIIVVIAVGLGLALIFSIICTVVIVLRRVKKKKKLTSNGLSSLRPSSHACVSIPNTYGGVGYVAAKSASYSSSQSDRNSAIATISSAHSSRRGHRKSNISDSISYESEIYEHNPESLKGSADPILTASDASFDCVDVSKSKRSSGKSEEVMINSMEGYINPVATIYNDETYSTPTSTKLGGFLTQEDIDSDLIYPVARPSLETITEEQEGEDSLVKTPHNSPPLEVRILETFPEESLSEFDFNRAEGDGESNTNSVVLMDDISVRTVSSEVKPKVGTRRVRVRPISMGDADKPESKRRLDKVEYALFKDDDTGNLDNFLDQRRVSV